MPARVRDLRTESDATLLLSMVHRATAGERLLSDRAAHEFQRRHMPALRSQCRLLCKSLGASDDLVEDLVACTLIRAAERAGTFKSEADAEEGKSRAPAWLRGIAKNLLTGKTFEAVARNGTS